MTEPSFEKLLVRLADAAVEFVVVGWVAVTLHGYARLTEDVDIVIRRTPENIQRLLTTLASYGEGFARELTAEEFTDDEGAIRIIEETEQSQIDIFTRLSDMRFDDLITDAPNFEVAGRTIRYASKAALLRFKGASSRDKDRIDVAALRKLQEYPRAFE
jgi:hypothetical protein